MKVPFQDLAAAYGVLASELDVLYQAFMHPGWYVLGNEVDLFEKDYAGYCEADFCMGVGNALDALHLALRARGISAGNEVIVPSNTHIATWLAVRWLAHLRFQLAKTSATLQVNVCGLPADYDPTIGIASEVGLTIVVDNAQAHGTWIQSRRHSFE